METPTKNFKPNRWLFLDFDGVLNSVHFNYYRQRKLDYDKKYDELRANCTTTEQADFNRMWYDLAPHNLFCLEWLCQEFPQMGIVISSAWRNTFKLEHIAEALEKFGNIPRERVVGKTSRVRLSGGPRSEEIIDYIEDEKIPLDSFAVVDDKVIFDLKHRFYDRQVITNSRDGLTMGDTFALARILYSQWKEPVHLF